MRGETKLAIDDASLLVAAVRDAVSPDSAVGELVQRTLMSGVATTTG